MHAVATRPALQRCLLVTALIAARWQLRGCVDCPHCGTWWLLAWVRAYRLGRVTQYYELLCPLCGAQRWRAR